MEKKLYVGNLPYSTSAEELNELFGQYGTVESVNIITDRDTGRSKGFGFVEMDTPESAKAAMDALDQSELGDRPLVVNEARPREE